MGMRIKQVTPFFQFRAWRFGIIVSGPCVFVDLGPYFGYYWRVADAIIE